MVALGQRAGLGNGAEVPLRVHERPVDEVAPVGEQLVVRAADELLPREVAVLRLGPGGGEVVAQRVGLVAVEEVLDPDRVTATRARLAAAHRQVLARDDVVRELQVVAVAHQHRGPDDGVEDDVVLAHEVEAARVRALPPLAPRLGPADVVRPLDGSGEVADHRVEPDVDALRVLGVALDRNGDAPVDVAGHRARLHLPREVEREVADVRPPVRLRLDPLDEPLAERGQVEEQVRRLAELGRRAVHDRARVDQVDRIELVAAVVALVASRLAVAADRAGPSM